MYDLQAGQGVGASNPMVTPTEVEGLTLTGMRLVVLVFWWCTVLRWWG